MQLLIIEKDAKCSHAAADAKCQHKTNRKINKDVGLIGFAGLAVIFRFAILAFDLREQPGTECPAPPGKTNLGRVALSAFGTGRILSWVLHVSSKEMIFDYSIQKDYEGNQPSVGITMRAEHPTRGRCCSALSKLF
jgi:hypothetical protein